MGHKHLIALGLAAASVAAQAQVLLVQGFEDPAVIASTWQITNNSTPAGNSPGWQLGSSSIFSAQAGTAGSFMSANFEAAGAGGTLNALLLSPVFSTATAVLIEFYARSEDASCCSDSIRYGWSNATGSVLTLSAPTVVGTADWVKYSFQIAAQGTGTTARFAVNYVGSADTANYVGIDSVTVTAVPEPSSVLMLGAGLAGLAAWTRRRQAR